MSNYRVGRKLGRTLYRGDQLIGIMDTAEDAALVVASLNASPPTAAPVLSRHVLSADERTALADLIEELDGNQYAWEGGTADIVDVLRKLLGGAP